MRWTIEHTVPAPLARVERALLDPATLAELPRFVPALAEVVPLGRTTGDGWIERVVHVRPELGVRLPAVVRPEWLAFDERTRWDLAGHSGRFEITPNLPARLRHRVRCDGTYRLLAGGDRTVRRVDGELAIDAGWLGPVLERAGVRIIARQFADEARMLAALAS